MSDGVAQAGPAALGGLRNVATYRGLNSRCTMLKTAIRAVTHAPPFLPFYASELRPTAGKYMPKRLWFLF